MYRVDITDREIMECRTAKAALRMSLDRSGRSLYAVSQECGITESHLSRCLNTNDSINLPHDKVLLFMTSCGNAIYLRWLYLRMRDLMPELEEDDGACIASEIESLKLSLTEAITEIKASLPSKQCTACGAHFALELGRPDVPMWLLAEAVAIEQYIGGKS
jgi:hypothetical protein